MTNYLTEDRVSEPRPRIAYIPASTHWFHQRKIDSKIVWFPFSYFDSSRLEAALISKKDDDNIVSVEGDRFEVNVRDRTKTAVYWESKKFEVRRCSWFQKQEDSKYVPYDEEIAAALEIQYQSAVESNTWRRTIITITNEEKVIIYGPNVIVHIIQKEIIDPWGGSTEVSNIQRAVRRGVDGFNIEQGESQRVDHLILVVHGIGAICDMNLHTIEEVVDDFRSIAKNLVKQHYKDAVKEGRIGRIEVLPISWHSYLHSDDSGIDEKLQSITLRSIPRLRTFTNETLLDVLFYTSPIYCQRIVGWVATSLNAVFQKYLSRNPGFNGGISLVGHSLGSLILFDLLSHQNAEHPNKLFLSQNPSAATADEKKTAYTMGRAGTGQPFIHYPQLVFHPKMFFAFGSPIGMFVTIRGLKYLSLEFSLPTCSGFYNIFHPYDPVAYRIEPLIDTRMSDISPVIIPHHKGRKRMHLELKETMKRFGGDLKLRFVGTFRSMMGRMGSFRSSTVTKKEVDEALQEELNIVIDQMEQQQREQEQREAGEESQMEDNEESPIAARQQSKTALTNAYSDYRVSEQQVFRMGKLNDTKRIDYMLQESPLEFFNEYLFALRSHVCYWQSADTVLFVIKEIYGSKGIEIEFLQSGSERPSQQ